MRALVVDNSKPSRSILMRSLRDLHFECAEASNGIEALDALKAGPLPDILTVDWHMPKMNGLELVQAIRKTDTLKHLRILMISTESNRKCIEQAQSAGVDDYLTKPFTPRSLAQALVGLGICSATEATPASASRPTRVLIVDDSSTIRSLLSSTLNADPDIEVVGAAVDGKQAIDMLHTCSPDLILLDVEMPVLDGIGALKEIRRLNPKLPVIMFSSLTERGAKTTVDALLAGANDYAPKPAGLAPSDVTAAIKENVITKIKSLVSQRISSRPRKITPLRIQRTESPRPVEGIVIAVSTGGPTALAEILPTFANNCPVPILIVQHMSTYFLSQLAERLTTITGIQVQEAHHDAVVAPGTVFLAPGESHLGITQKGGRVHAQILHDPPENSCRPAADVLFRAAATVWGTGTLGVVLTGMGRDGLAGSQAIIEHGGRVIVQDEVSSTVWGMPGHVANAGLADAILPLMQLGTEINMRVKRQRN